MTNQPKLGLQLYTLREAMAKDFSGTLKQIAEIGFDGVESAFFAPEITLERASRELRDLGLNVFCAHTDLPFGDKSEGVLKIAEAFGCKRVVWHGWPQDPRYSSVSGLQQLADEYNAANEIAVSNGLSLGIHNHWWEMKPIGSDGPIPYQFYLKVLDPRIFFELDAYWATVAGRHAPTVIQDLGACMPLMHLKDGPLTRSDPMQAIGTGKMDVPAVINAARAHTEWVIVELDECATDMMTAVQQSYRYLRGLLASK